MMLRAFSALLLFFVTGLAHAAWTFVGSASDHGTSTTPDVVHGLTISEGDLVVAYVNTNGSGNNITATAGTGAAWTAQRDDIGVSGETATYAIFSKEANASEPATFEFGIDSSQRWGLVVFVADPGVDPFSLDVAGGQTLDTGDSPYTIGGITVSADSIAFAFLGQDNLGAGGTADESWSVDNSYLGVEEDSADQASVGAYRIFASSGSTGDVTFTAATNDSETVAYGEHIAFKLGAGGGGSEIPTTLRRRRD